MAYRSRNLKLDIFNITKLWVYYKNYLKILDIWNYHQLCSKRYILFLNLYLFDIEYMYFTNSYKIFKRISFSLNYIPRFWACSLSRWMDFIPVFHIRWALTNAFVLIKNHNDHYCEKFLLIWYFIENQVFSLQSQS